MLSQRHLNYFCVPNGKENSSRTGATPPPASDKPVFSTSLSIVIAISAPFIIALVAAFVCLIWKIRRRTKDHANQADDPSTVFSNKAFGADSFNERHSISHREVDLGLGSADSGGEMAMDSRPVYEVCSRPLPPIPPQQKTSDRMPGAAERPANGNNDVTGTAQFAVHCVGLSGRNEGSAQTSIPELNTHACPYHQGDRNSGLNSSGAKAKRSKRPKNNGQERRERKELYVNVQK